MKRAQPYQSARGNVPQGPARWERAALNAVHNPNSAAARLYRSRVKLATLLADASLHPDTPFEFVSQDHVILYRRKSVGRSIEDVPFKRDHMTCSTYCTIMQVQLDFRTSSLEDIGTVLREGRWGRKVRGLDTAKLKRDATCFVCGSTVKRTK